MSTPNIVLVGPTNVGKSTLFNRLTHTRKAIVCDRPGVTVDRHELEINDTPVGKVKIIDTGGVGPTALEHPLGASIEKAAQRAIKEASVILMVVDGTRDLALEELEVASWIRHKAPSDIPVWVIVNKSDSKKFDESSYYGLGFSQLFKISSEHGEGITEIWDALKKELGEGSDVEEVEEERSPQILVLGRPNVGKSTLLNTLIGEERSVVSDMPGTTRDIMSTTYLHKGWTWTLHDSAGIRRPGRLEREVEWVAKEKIKDLARKADLAILLLDSEEGVTDQDAHIAGMALDFNLSLIIAFNKTDKLQGPKAEDLISKLERSSDLKLDFLSWCPKVSVSALTGKGTKELLKQIEIVLKARKGRVTTGQLNQIFDKKMKYHPHPKVFGKMAKFYYISQVGSNPPEFILFTNISGAEVHFSYRRFIENALRKEFDFWGTPIKVHFRLA